MVPGILVLMVESVILQCIDHLGNVRLAQRGAFNHLGPASMLELSVSKGRLGQRLESQQEHAALLARSDVPSCEWIRDREKLPPWQQ